MVHIRSLLWLLLLAAFALSACASPESTVPSPSHVAQASATATSAGGRPDKDIKATCFSPEELLPFAFTPDSSQLAVRAKQGIQFFHLETGKELTSLTAPQSVLTAALSPDGQTLAWSLADNSIQLIQVPDGATLHSFQGHPDPVLDLRFSPNGSKLFSSSHDGIVRVWDTTEGTLLSAIQVGMEVLGIGVSPDGSTLAVVPSDGPVQLWDIATAQPTNILGGTGGYDTSDPVFSPDGKYLAADLATGIFIWSLPDGREIWTDVANSMSVAYSPDGTYFTYTDINESNGIFLGLPDAESGFQVVDEMAGPVWELFFSADSSLLAATDGIEIRVWRVSDGELLAIGKAFCQ